jgi:hypothetical protein
MSAEEARRLADREVLEQVQIFNRLRRHCLADIMHQAGEGQRKLVYRIPLFDPEIPVADVYLFGRALEKWLRLKGYKVKADCGANRFEISF